MLCSLDANEKRQYVKCLPRTQITTRNSSDLMGRGGRLEGNLDKDGAHDNSVPHAKSLHATHSYSCEMYTRVKGKREWKAEKEG